MTTFLLLRHAHSVANDQGVLAGRVDGVVLSKVGESQAKKLPKALEDWKINRFFSSPLDRCIMTVKPILADRSKKVFLDKEFIEMDYGLWSGKKLSRLRREKGWKRIQREPMSFTFPEGEAFSSAAHRIERRLRKLSNLYPKETILIVTHGDIIKLATQLTLDGDLNKFQRLVVDTCSLTVLEWNRTSRSLVSFNQRLIKSSKKQSRRNTLKNRHIVGGGSGV